MTVAGIRRARTTIGPVDFLLTCVGSILAVYSVGLSIAQEALSMFFAGLTLAGTIVSLMVNRLAGDGLKKYDGILYLGVGVFAIFGFGMLNSVLPDDGFPRMLMPAAVLSWLIGLGSFFTWRDSTILFQAIPSIALFGLVGCYDTFKNAPFAFFGFLICLATLLARAHGRTMLRQAAASGFFGLGFQGEPDLEHLDKIRMGPWRWVAGPEWALGSALVIVLISLIGAPVIQASVKPISGLVSVAAPPVRRSPSNTARNLSQGDSVRISRGPNNLSATPLYEVEMDQARYLRTATFNEYTGRGWSFVDPYRFGPEIDAAGKTVNLPANDVASKEIKAAVKIDFTITPLVDPTNRVPMPGQFLDGDPVFSPTLDGHYTATGISAKRPIRGSALVASDEILPTEARTDLPLSIRDALSNRKGVDGRVAEFMRDAAGTAGTDFEKAERIRAKIASTIRYNIKADAAPADRDPVDYVLFEKNEAYCDVFASAMVLGARAANIPARYVIGFLPDEANRTGSKYVVREADYHAWAELFFKDVGWVVFDATEGAEAVEGAERGAVSDTRPWFRQEWFVRVLNGAIALGVIGFLVLAYAAFRPQAKAGRVAVEEFEGLYVQFNRRLERWSGIRRAMSRTPSEYLQQLAPMLGALAGEAERLNRRFESLLFGQATLTGAETSALKAELRAFTKQLQQTKAVPVVPSYAVVAMPERDGTPAGDPS